MSLYLALTNGGYIGVLPDQSGRSDGCVGLNYPHLQMQMPYTQWKLQVELAARALALMPMRACEQSDRWGYPHVNRFSCVRGVLLRWPVLKCPFYLRHQQAERVHALRQPSFPPDHLKVMGVQNGESYELHKSRESYVG